MPDERTDPSAAFALRLSADILTALVVAKTLSPKAVDLLISDCLTVVTDSHAEHAPILEQIAVTLRAQVRLAAIERDRLEAEMDE